MNTDEKRRRKKRAAAAKRRAEKAKPKVKPYSVAKTVNGQRIQKLLVASDRDPASYKDWTVLLPGQLLDWHGVYSVTNTEGKPLALDGAEVLLVHKRELHKFIFDGLASQFWNRGLGTRVSKAGPAGAPPRRVPVKATPRKRKPPKDEGES